MTPELRAQLDAKLFSLRQFLSACPPRLDGVRLVQYCGVDLLGTSDVALEDLEAQVAGSMCEGLRVDWVCRNEFLYLRVFAGDGPVPSWERVFAEEELANVRSILRAAGFGNEA